MVATLAQLLAVRSRLAAEAETFLERLAGAIDTTPWEVDGQPLRASDAFVEPVLITARERSDQREDGPGARKRETDHGILPGDEQLHRLYERERLDGKHEEKRWGQVVRPGNRLRLAIIGEPGGGKTCATRHAVAELAKCPMLLGILGMDVRR